MIDNTTNPIRIQEILSLLKSVKRCGDNWVALCPSHDDAKHSLSISEKPDKILMHCHAGCSLNDICAAIGLKVSDLFNDHGQNGQADPIVATYDYRDAEGNFLYRVVRTASKKFWQQRPGQNGQWINNLGGVSPTLYRLPEILKAVENGDLIFIVEGEKDVENLVKVGLVATTSPMGAGKWRPAFAEYLTGANVVVLPDNDEPGRKHAEQIARSLHGKAASVKMLELPNLPPKGDVSDWLAAGGERDELLILAAECPEWKAEAKAEAKNTKTPVIVRLADVEPEAVQWLWEPYIPLGKLTLLEGDPGLGKTWLALQLAAIISNGDPFSGDNGIPKARREPASIIYMTAEDGLADTLRPRLDKAGANVNHIFALTGWMNDEKTGAISLSDLPMIEATIQQTKAVMIVVDPIQAFLGSGVDMHRANEVRPILSGLAGLAEKYKVAVICIRHLGKSQKDRAMYRGLGSIDFAAAARSVLLVGEDPSNNQKRIMAHCKSSLAAKGASIAFELSNDGFAWCGVSSLTAEDLVAAPRNEEEKSAVDEAEEFLREALADGGRPAKEVLKEAANAGINEKSLRRAMDGGKIKVMKCRMGTFGKGGGFWVWELAKNSEEEVF